MTAEEHAAAIAEAKAEKKQAKREFGWLKRLLCSHPRIDFVRNIYGDEIILRGMKRSEWKCAKCGALVFRDELEKFD